MWEEAIENARDSAKDHPEAVPLVREHFTGDPEIINGLEEQLDKLAPMRQEVLTLASQNRKRKPQNIWRPTTYRPYMRPRRSWIS